MRAVRFDQYGSDEVLEVVDVEEPRPAPGRVVVEVLATSVNPGEIMIREGAMAEQSSFGFPMGQGSDLAGRVVSTADDVVEWNEGDEVIGWTEERAAQAERVSVPGDQLVPKPDGVPWDQAGCLYVAGCTAAGMVSAVDPQPDETVVVAGATGGVGSIAVQLLRGRGVDVIGIAGPDNDAWLTDLGARPVNYGDGVAQRLAAAAPDGVAAFLDAYGSGYVDVAVRLGTRPERVVTIIDFGAGERLGVQELFSYQIASARMLANLAALVDAGELSIPIAATYDLADVRAAYQRLADRHTRGKIVLHPVDA